MSKTQNREWRRLAPSACQNAGRYGAALVLEHLGKDNGESDVPLLVRAPPLPAVG